MSQTVEDLFDEIDRRAQAKLRLKNSKAWRILPQMDFYINSEFRCPLCDGTHKTNLVYLVDTLNRRMVGCWTYPEMNPVGNNGKEVIHPHSDHNGKLCMGTARSVPGLLFNGVAPGKHHRHTDAWLLMIGHECKGITKSPCVVCGIDEYKVYSIPYNKKWVCSPQCEALAHKSICYKCGDYSGHDAVKNYCIDCFHEESTPCMHCGKRVLMKTLHYVGSEFYICYDCYDNESGQCAECNIPVPYMSMRSKRCPGCHPRECVRCYTIRKTSDLVNGRCERCRPKSYCSCGNQVPAAGLTCEICTTRLQAPLPDDLVIQEAESVIPLIVDPPDPFNEPPF